MKRLFLVLLTVSLIPAAVFAGGSRQGDGSQTSGGAQKTLSVYTWADGFDLTIQKAILDDYQAAHPEIKIEYNPTAYNEYHAKMNAMVAANSTPDIFQMNEFLVTEWGEKSIGEDLKPLYQKAGINSDDLFLAPLIWTSNGHLWGVSGVTPGMGILYYNKKLFRDAGITPPPDSTSLPWTWQQYADAAKKLTKDSKGRKPGDSGFDYDDAVQWGTMMPTSWLWWAALLYTDGQGVANADGTGFGMNNPGAIRIIQSIADMSLKDKSAPSTAMTSGGAFSSASTMLMNDQLAMVIAGNWEYIGYADEKYDVGIAQIPSFSGKGGNIAWSNGFMLKKGASPEAFDLYRHLVETEPRAAAARKHNLTFPNGMPPTKLTVSTPSVADGLVPDLSMPLINLQNAIMGDPGTKQGENVYVKNWSEIVDAIIVPEFDKVWMGVETASQAIQSLAVQLQGKWQGLWK
ncbi:MAG: extracellular solute-binding protein [Treponema sp.]|jgi:multiple sugar transport system substrate-binding protein|nr:extracellular solute-binding protein [Treponema sp.]